MFLLLGLAICLSSGCVTKPEGQPSIVLRSEVISATVQPDFGARVMAIQAYGFDNMFWTNKKLSVPMWGWVNYGGEKTWIGPQENWEKLTGSPWPPPLSFDRLPYHVITQTVSSVTLQSSVDTNFNVAVWRQIDIASNTLHVTSKLIQEPSKDEEATVRHTNWTVAQFPHPEFVYVHLSEKRQVSNGSDHDKKLPEPSFVDGTTNILVFDLKKIQTSGKAYFDADMFGMEISGGCLLMTHHVQQVQTSDSLLPERAQLYANVEADLPPGYEKYIELEFSQSTPDSEHCITYTFIPANPGTDAQRAIIEYMERK